MPRIYQVAIIVYDDPDFGECGHVHFAAQHTCPIVLSRYLREHIVPGGKIVWWRWK